MSLDQTDVPIKPMNLDDNSNSEPERGLKDEVLLASSRENPQLFGILVDRYQSAFLRAAMRVVHRREDAEDIVQEAFLRIYKNAHRFVKQENVEFKSWAYKVVLNTSFTHYQRLKKQSLRQESDGEAILAMGVADDSSMGEEIEIKILVERSLEVLPPDLARVLLKHYIEDKAYETIAAEEQNTVAAIKMRLYRARKAMKKLLGRGSGSNKERAENGAVL